MSLSKLFGDQTTTFHQLVPRPLSSKVKCPLGLLTLILIVILYIRQSFIWFTGPSSLSTTELRPELQSSTVTAFLPVQEAEALCSSYNWLPYPNRTSPRKIYDLFLI